MLCDITQSIQYGGDEIVGGLPTLLTPGNLNVRKAIPGMDMSTPMAYLESILKSKMFEHGGKSTSVADRIYLVEAKTGSGKSTTMPVVVYRLLNKAEKNSVIVTQPKVLTAQDIPTNQVAGQPWAKDMVLGVNIGYTTGELKLRPTSDSSLIYSTVGSLMKFFQSNTDEAIMNRYRIIIIDEVHTRDADLDILIMYIKRLMDRNPDNQKCPFVILTSATFEVDTYAKYFGLRDENIIMVSGSVFDIQESFLDVDSKNYEESIIDTVNLICHMPLPQYINELEILGTDILIFLPGTAKKVADKLNRFNEKLRKEGKPMFIVLVINSAEVRSEGPQKRLIHVPLSEIKLNDELVYDRNGKYPVNRRIIISTNVAETGLTLDDLGYVIDAGFDKKKESYPPYGIVGLTTKPATLPNVMQRRGRVGRKFPGMFFGIYTKKTFESLQKIKLPSIFTDDTNDILLKIVAENDEFDIEKIDMIDPPPTESLKQSLEFGIILGFLNQYPKLHLTEMGKNYLQTKMNMRWFRVIMSAFAYNACVLDVIAASAYFEVSKKDYIVKSINFVDYFGKQSIFDSYDQFKLLTMDDFIEDIFLFETFRHIIENVDIKKIETITSKLGFVYRGMMGVLQKYVNIIDEIAKLGFNVNANADKRIINATPETYLDRVKEIKQCIHDGFRLNLIVNGETRHGLKVKYQGKVPTLHDSLYNAIEQSNAITVPKYIIAHNIEVKDVMKIPTYTFKVAVDKVSILDGYIPVDILYIDPMFN